MAEESRPGEWDAARYQREMRSFIEKRSLLRPITLHAALIFTVTGMLGWLCSWILLKAGTVNMPLRYAASFLVSYLVFALCVRVWADSMRQERDGNLLEGAADFAGADGEGCLFVAAVFLVSLVLAGLFALLGGVPLLLEVAFEVVFAGVVVRRLGRRETLGDWSGRLVRGTWLPALLIGLALVAVAGWLHHQAPHARTLAEAVRALRADGR